MKITTKRLICLLLIALTALTTVFFFSCADKTEPLPPAPEYESFTRQDFISAAGTELRIGRGGGDKIVLRGVNAGGLLVTEAWMCAVKATPDTGSLYHKKITEIFTERFGAERTAALWEHYRKNFWTRRDFANCADMGINVIRLPFTYMNVDPEYNNVAKIAGQKFNFSVLDEFVETAEQYGLYTILDMHGAYGSQNGQDHSGETMSSAAEVDFYYNEEKQNKTIELWSALAAHYKDNPAIAGYDILNEPGEKAGTTGSRHWAVFDKIYDAIRERDKDHVVIMESCWDAHNLPEPSSYGWENVMYSFHHYTNARDDKTHIASFREKLKNIVDYGFKVPLYMGEFTAYGLENGWKETLRMLNDGGWHWTSWSYKINRQNDTSYPGWGIYYSKAPVVYPADDSYDEIMAKWNGIATYDESQNGLYYPQTFDSDVRLDQIIAEYAGRAS